jgi:hypothetical protein
MLHLGSVWFDVSAAAKCCAIWLVSDKEHGPGFMANGDHMLKECDDIYAD